jgi:hypothetical protein
MVGQLDKQSEHSLSGLSDDVAAERLRTEGFNELPRPGQRSFARIVLDVLREPMLTLQNNDRKKGLSHNLDGGVSGSLRWFFL